MIVTVAMLKGGTGKTTTAAHLLQALHHQHGSAAGIDTDSQASLLGWAEAAGEGWPSVVTAVTPQKIQRTVAHEAGRFDHLVIDTPNDPSRSQAVVTAAAAAADVVVVPVTPTAIEFARVVATLHVLQAAEPPRVALLLTQALATTSAASQGPEVLAEIADDNGCEVLDAIIPRREAIAQSYGTAEVHPSYADAADQLAALLTTQGA